MKPAIIALVVSTVLVVAGWVAYSKFTEKIAAEKGIHVSAK